MEIPEHGLCNSAAIPIRPRVLLFAAFAHREAALGLLRLLGRYAPPAWAITHLAGDLNDCAPPEADLLLLWLDGDETLTDTALRRWAARAPLLLMAPGRLDSVPMWLHAGARDFTLQGVGAEELVLRVERAMAAGGTPPRAGVSPVPGAREVNGMVGRSAVFLQQVKKLALFARCDADVLILGETGTGKEVFAQAVHYTSARAGKPFIALNCGAIPHELIENELFGHARGAYTTAHSARSGLVREAQGGSLFLDDIDCLTLMTQPKLLRFLQEREYRPVGANSLLRADVRVITASNRDLSALAMRGQFRQDLYYRLNVLSFVLPPLRERREDISELTLYFLRQFARRFNKPVEGFTPAALRKLLLHTWPGNVRELQHVVERGVLLAAGTVLDSEDIDVGSADEGREVELFQAAKARVIQRFERHYIESLLSSTQGNVADAARAAGKHRRAFFELIRKHRIVPERFRPNAG